MSGRQVEPRWKAPQTFKKPKAVRRTSKKRDAGKDYRQQVWRQILDRDGGCVVAGEPWVNGEPHVCRGKLTPHHVRKASAGGAFSARNLMVLCARGNDDLEDFPSLSELYPWLVCREGDERWPSLGRRAA